MKKPWHEDRLIVYQRKTQSKTNKRAKSELIPIDLLIEILSRFPTKSIARCRIVSKLWASILRRPDFTELFLTRSSARPQLLFAYQKHGKLLFFSSPQPENPDLNSSLVSANHLADFPLSCYYKIDSPISGLVFIIAYQKGRKENCHLICNPSTGQSLTLPKVKTRRVDVDSFLGYDPIDKQFKLLSMSLPSYGRYRISEEHQVLTLGTGKLAWRMIECSVPHYPLYGGICINGVLYYQAVIQGFKGDFGIACFDVRSEKFKFLEEANGLAATLVNYKGKLATLTPDSEFGTICGKNRSFELCVLQDTEKHEWSKHTYILPSLWKDMVGNVMLYIDGVTRTGEVVLSPCNAYGNFYLIYYNLERNTIVKVGIQGMEVFKRKRVHTFVNHVEDVGEMLRTS